jgi:hypothetical protein
MHGLTKPVSRRQGKHPFRVRSKAGGLSKEKIFTDRPDGGPHRHLWAMDRELALKNGS